MTAVVLPREDLIVQRPEGLWCAAGGFHIDPWRPVPRALITHAHADHARTGHGRYLAVKEAERVLRQRLGTIELDTVAYGERVAIGDTVVSFHPAGHVLGASQVRVEHRGEVWVVSGDYKVEPDPTCAPFEPVRCDTFITESTFGLPIYRWQREAEIMDEVNRWWVANADAGRASILYCYAFGKAQRLLAGVDPSIGTIVCHGAAQPLNRAYRETGVPLPETRLVTEVSDKAELRRALVLAPPSAAGSTWVRRFGEHADAFASGWMRLRGARRRRGVDRGFVLSDHADWPGLQRAIRDTGASRVIVTHGYEGPMVRWLRENGLEAGAFRTEYGIEDDTEDAAAPPGTEAVDDSARMDARRAPRDDGA